MAQQAFAAIEQKDIEALRALQNEGVIFSDMMFAEACNKKGPEGTAIAKAILDSIPVSQRQDFVAPALLNATLVANLETVQLIISVYTEANAVCPEVLDACKALFHTKTIESPEHQAVLVYLVQNLQELDYYRLASKVLEEKKYLQVFLQCVPNGQRYIQDNPYLPEWAREMLSGSQGGC